MASRTKRRPPAKTSRTPAKPATRSAPARATLGAPKPIGRLQAHRREIGGVGLLLLAGLSGLGIWLGVAGNAGDFLGYLAGGAVGLGSAAVPVALAAFGVALLRKREGELTRYAAGGALAGIGLTGLLYLLRPAPPLMEGLEAWRRAGGALGAMVGQPLRSLAGPWGAGLILAALAFVGCLILFRLSFDQAWRGVRRAAVATWHAMGGGLRRLTTLKSERGAATDVVAADLHTHDTRELHQPPPKQGAPKRRFRAGIDHDEEDVAAPETSDDAADEVEAEVADLTAALTVDVTDQGPEADGGRGAVGAVPAPVPTAAPAPVGEDLVLQSPAFVGQPAGAPTQLELGLVPGEQRWKLPSESCLTRKAAKPIDRKLVE